MTDRRTQVNNACSFGRIETNRDWACNSDLATTSPRASFEPVLPCHTLHFPCLRCLRCLRRSVDSQATPLRRGPPGYITRHINPSRPLLAPGSTASMSSTHVLPMDYLLISIAYLTLFRCRGQMNLVLRLLFCTTPVSVIKSSIVAEPCTLFHWTNTIQASTASDGSRPS